MNVDPPANAPVIPDVLAGLDEGGEAAADFDDDQPVAPSLPADEYDHDRDGAPARAAPGDDGGAPAPTPAAVAPTPPAPTPAATPPAEPPKLVPVAELVTERARRQDLQRQNEELQARLAAQAQPPAPPAPTPPPEPDVDYLEDPKGYVDQQVKRAVAQLQKPLDEVKEQTTQVSQQTAQQQALQQIATSINQAEATFAAQTPDYMDALVHLRTSRMNELRVFQPEATDDQLLNYIRVEELRGAAALIQAGRNPAEVAYQYAKLRGYQPRQPNGQGGPQIPVPTPDEAARQQARGLPMGGGTPDLQPTQEQSNVMPEFSSALRERFGIGR